MSFNNEIRPDPDSLLSLVNHDSEYNKKGKLKIFFGSSAGVGKTFAMLSEAKALKDEGVDVVIGVVETHGRVETAKMLSDIPALPLKILNHKNIELKEFDVDAALARRPQLILVDELAHSNIAESRHPKRWQDVQELLDNGIDVYTSLNVQHIESVNDVVTKITGIEVKETIPDEVFDNAHEIELIDISSDELLKRLKQGKVYIAEGAGKRAIDNFFKKTNLVALREIALRRTAERVDAQMDMLTSAAGRSEAKIGEKILVCIGHDELSAKVIRHARRLAARSKAKLIGIYVETSRHARLSERAKVQVERNIRMAERLGAKIVNISGGNAAEEIINYASHNGITRIIIGNRSHKISLFSKTLAEELVDRSSDMEITIVTSSYAEKRNIRVKISNFFFKPSYYIYTFFFIGLFTAICFPFRGLIDNNSFAMFYIMAVVFVAARYGVVASVIASVLGVCAFNFFFTEPFYTLSVDDPIYYYTFAIMIITGLITGSMASKLSLQATQARKREKETASLYELAKALSKTRGIDNMSLVAIQQMNSSFDLETTIFIAQDEKLYTIPEHSLANNIKEESVARWVVANNKLAGKSTDTLPSSKALHLPLSAEAQVLGVLCMVPKHEEHDFTLEEISRFESFASIIASSFLRAKKADIAEANKVESESEKLRNILLSSVSHDLRTPLASINGAASSLIMMKKKLPDSAHDLLRSIHGQTARLSRLVTNLLDVTNLESGNINLNKQPYFIDELIGTALIRVEELKEGRQINVLIQPELPLVNVDGILIEQVLINLLENSIRFTDAQNGYIEIEAILQGDNIMVSVSDNGIGICKGDEEKIFEKFYTNTKLGLSNTGLGLTICRGIISTHSGNIWAENTQSGGAKIIFTLPVMQNLETDE